MLTTRFVHAGPAEQSSEAIVKNFRSRKFLVQDFVFTVDNNIAEAIHHGTEGKSM